MSVAIDHAGAVLAPRITRFRRQPITCPAASLSLRPREDGPLTGRAARRRVVRVTVPSDGFPGATAARADLLVTEEPLGIRVNGSALTMTMRTPGDDIELAAGFLVGEAVVRSHDDIAKITLCDGTSCGHGGHHGMGNVADVLLAPGVQVGSAARRNFLTTSACGVCGKTSIEDICVLPAASLGSDKTQFSPSVLASLPDRLRQAQRVFARTGGLHAAGLFTSSGELMVIREDVGRHNAVDKLVGYAMLQGQLPLAACWSADAPRLSSCRRRCWLESRCSRQCRHRPRSPPTWPRRRD